MSSYTTLLCSGCLSDVHCCVGFLNLQWVKPDHFPSLTHSVCLVLEEILERVRAKQEREMDQVKKKAAEEMQKSKREESQEHPAAAEQEETEANPAGSNG